MFDIIRHAFPSLPVVTLAQRNGWMQTLSHAEGAGLHVAWMREVPCLTALRHEVCRSTQPLAFPFRLAAWNLERCYDVPGAAWRLGGHDAVLLSEMDVGMARTHQVDTVAELARMLDAEALFGVEFIELGLGSPKEATWVQGQHNEVGWHGNAVLSRSPMGDPRLWRLDGDGGRWYTSQSPEARVGGRCAVGARVQTTQGPLWLVSVHLEYSGTPEQRARDVESLLDALHQDSGEEPVVLGGDFNTSVVRGQDLSGEPLFALAAARGFHVHAGSSGEVTVRRSRVSEPRSPLRLDWIFTRGVSVGHCEVVPAVDAQGQPLSDHELVSLSVEGLRT